VSKLCFVNYSNFLKHCISIISATCPTHFILSRNHETSRYTIFYILMLFPLHKIHIFSSQRRSQTPCIKILLFNPLTPNDDYSGRTAPLTSKCFILYIYSTNIGTEYFKHGIYSPFFPLQNAVCFINLTYLVPVLFTFYIQGVLKLKK